MDVKVTVGGVEATITVDGPDEAARLLRSLGGQDTTPERIVDDRGNPDEDVDSELVRSALSELRGSQSGRLVMALKVHSDGCTDQQLRDTLAVSSDANLGPLFANLSKACKNWQISREDVLRTRKRRLSGGKVQYFYQLTPLALRGLEEVGDLNEEDPDAFF